MTTFRFKILLPIFIVSLRYDFMAGLHGSFETAIQLGDDAYKDGEKFDQLLS